MGTSLCIFCKIYLLCSLFWPQTTFSSTLSLSFISFQIYDYQFISLFKIITNNKQKNAHHQTPQPFIATLHLNLCCTSFTRSPSTLIHLIIVFSCFSTSIFLLKNRENTHTYKEFRMHYNFTSHNLIFRLCLYFLIILDAAGSRAQVVLSYPQKLYQLSPSDTEVQMQVRKSKTFIREKNICVWEPRPVQSLGTGVPKHC